MARGGFPHGLLSSRRPVNGRFEQLASSKADSMRRRESLEQTVQSLVEKLALRDEQVMVSVLGWGVAWPGYLLGDGWDWDWD